MLIKPFLGRTVIGRRYDQQAINRQLGQLPRPIHSSGGTARADTRDDLHPLPGLGTGSLRQLPQLGFAQGSGFASGSTHDNPAGAARQVKIDEALPCTEIYGTIRPHRRDNGDQAA